MEDELDPFEFFLAEKLGKTLAEVRELPNNEYNQWRAYFTWKHAMQEFELEKQSKKRKR